ncbi:MAG: type II toxin-antitoxin system prevent-host-death family antitoxin, partial [Armatimonadetes bacterium]|nr:type II toxin-antitoxin system prevent-host-death family antitoxin [Armatimonadota bacterium]
DRAIIARHGKPMAALISIDEYERWKRYREQAFAVFRQVWEANRTAEPAQVERDVAEAVQEVRQTKRVRR